MTRNSKVVPLRQPEVVDDPLTAVLRSGARRLLSQAIEAEAEAFLALMKGVQLPDGRDRVVRHGHAPERSVETGIGPVKVQRVKLRDRGAGAVGERIRFTSAILPRWSRRTRSLDALLPILYLRGVSMGDFQEALTALLGRDAPNLSPSVIARLRNDWEADYGRWQRRDLSARHYVYIWADGVYLQARMEPQAECMLVLIGATPEGKKELLGFQVGMRESAQSWRELLVDLKARGLAVAPELATGDGALGFWKALEEVSPTTRHQRCTVHKTANVLDKLPKSVQPAGKADLREIWAAPDRATAQAAIATFAEKYGTKYAKAVSCLIKDRDALLNLLRLSRRALGPSADIESNRERVRHGAASHGADQGRAVPGHRPADGVQAGHGSGQNLAPAEGREPVAQSRPGHHIPKRRRGHQDASAERRLITASPSFGHSSATSPIRSQKPTQAAPCTALIAQAAGNRANCTDPGSALAIFAAIALTVATGYLISAGAGLSCVALFAGVGFGLGFAVEKECMAMIVIGHRPRRPRQQNDRADYNPRPDTSPALPAVSKKVKPDESKGIDQNKQND